MTLSVVLSKNWLKHFGQTKHDIEWIPIRYVKMSHKIPRLKVVVIGDPVCGKTSMLMAFCHNGFSDRHIPTVIDTFAKSMEMDGKTVEVSFWDTAGQEDYDRLRPLSYCDSDVVVIAFAVDDPVSLQNVTAKWYPEARHYMPNKPLILVATKTDLRQPLDGEETTFKERSVKAVLQNVDGEAAAFRIQANAYHECSAKLNAGVRECFETAVRKALENQRARTTHSSCALT